jgi:hypothetical protein
MAEILSGTLVLNGVNATFKNLALAINRLELTQESYSSHQVRMEDLRVFDDYKTHIAIAGTSDDDLGWSTGGTYGTNVPYVTAGDVKAVTKTRKARLKYMVPMNYVSGQPARFVFFCGMITTVADTSCTLDLSAFKEGSGGLISGGDLVTTAAQSINGGPAGTFAEVNFDLTVASPTLSPGDWLDLLITIASVDAATATAVIPAISKIMFQGATKG